MDYGGDYGVDYGGGGGGFVSHGGGGFSSSPQHGDSSPGKGGAKPSTTVQTLTPVTVAQLSHAVQAHSEDTFRIDGKELHQITFVGQVLNATPSSTNITFQITDGTGSVDVRIWLDGEDEGAQNGAQWRYVLAAWTRWSPAASTHSLIARSLSQTRHVCARHRAAAFVPGAPQYRGVPLAADRELQRAHLPLPRGHLRAPLQPQGPAGGTGSFSLSLFVLISCSLARSSTPHVSQSAGGAAAATYNQFGSGVANPYQAPMTTTSDTNDVGRAILDVIKKCPMSEGANIAYLEQALRHISPVELRYASLLLPHPHPYCPTRTLTNSRRRRQVEILSGDGLLYSTIDEDHFKAAD